MDTAPDEHDNIVQDAPAEIPYHPVVYSENEMTKRSQYFYETMKVRRSVRCFSSRPISLKIIQSLIKTAGFFDAKFILTINIILKFRDGT